MLFRSAEQAKHVIGIQANMWTEYVGDLPYAEYMTYPRALALAEVAWSPKGTKDYEAFKNRVKAHKLLPPNEMKGRGIPMVGTNPIVIPMLIDK